MQQRGQDVRAGADGCPSAIAPPLTLTARAAASTRADPERLGGKGFVEFYKSISSRVSPASLSAFDGAGHRPIPMKAGSTPAAA